MTEATNAAPKNLIGFLDYYLVQKAPFQLPPNAKEWIVKFGPWITVVLLILALPPLLFILGIGTALMPVGGATYAAGFGLAAIVLLIEVGLLVAALPGLFARKMSGWRLLFYSQLAAITLSLLSGSIVAGLLIGLMAMYILFQIRPLYR